MILFEDAIWQVKTGWLTGFKVLDKVERTWHRPKREQSIRMGFTLQKIRQGRLQTSPATRKRAEDELCKMFARAVTDPDTEEAVGFLGRPEHELITFIEDFSIDYEARVRQASAN
ncbi:hypothetical protein [Palleronia pelagia]|uniref:Uncharacterized protein n=1 Tax=Palleronia pelagia TaxID=387096 RepID=A0A1H8HZD8_9RHOB|nr:hypothetical protein [Palleronia pelagia]SEN60968.1 hypothetical protein SAMN04488011_10539 [Palleronia pelagia]